MGRPVLFGLRYSVYTRIAALCMDEKQVEFAFEAVDIFGEDGVPAEQLQRHPFGKIPAFEHDALKLYETSAICRYVDEAFDGPALQPLSVPVRARMNQAIGVLDAYAYRPMVWDLYVERVANVADGLPSDERRIATAIPVVECCLTQLSAWLSDNSFLTGEQLTLADLHALPMLHYLAKTAEGVNLLSRHANVERWMEQLNQRESVLAMTRSDPA